MPNYAYFLDREFACVADVPDLRDTKAVDLRIARVLHVRPADVAECHPWVGVCAVGPKAAAELAENGFASYAPER